MEQQIIAMVREVQAANALTATAREESRLLRLELDKLRKSWWPYLRDAINRRGLQNTLNATELFWKLTEKSIDSSPEYLPATLVKAKIAELILDIDFSEMAFSVEDKKTWKESLASFINVIGNSALVPMPIIKKVVDRLPPGVAPNYVGLLSGKVSILEAEGLADKVKSVIDIAEYLASETPVQTIA